MKREIFLTGPKRTQFVRSVTEKLRRGQTVRFPDECCLIVEREGMAENVPNGTAVSDILKKHDTYSEKFFLCDLSEERNGAFGIADAKTHDGPSGKNIYYGTGFRYRYRIANPIRLCGKMYGKMGEPTEEDVRAKTDILCEKVISAAVDPLTLLFGWPCLDAEKECFAAFCYSILTEEFAKYGLVPSAFAFNGFMQVSSLVWKGRTAEEIEAKRSRMRKILTKLTGEKTTCDEVAAAIYREASEVLC